MIFALTTLIACGDYVFTKAGCRVVNGKPEIHFGHPNKTTDDAWACYNNSIHANGWYKMHVHGRKGAKSEDIMLCAGFLEGALAQEGIFNHYLLIREIKKYPVRARTYPPKVKDFMQRNLNYVRLSVDSYPDDKYWQKIGLIMKQFDGIVAGYNYTANETSKLDDFDHWFFQSAGDMFDIAAIFKDDAPPQEFREHCTGLVRLTDNFDDVFFAHDAWSDYRELHGQLKEYDFHLPEFTAGRIVMSTRVGKIASYDDFYLTDSGLFVIETTLNNYNDKLYDVVVPQCLFTWMRAVLSTWTTSSGKEWAETFIRHNSGTYNNQYVIIDSKKFTRYQKPTSDLLWIIEQFPGDNWRMSDLTQQLVKNGYFPSVNCPYHEDLYKIAGYPELVKSMGVYGAYRSNDHSPRFQIITREAHRIKTFDDFKAFMRYNNWKRDPYSQHDPAQQIASRYDLREFPTPYGSPNNFGDLDSKCLRLTEAVTLMRMHAIASPPYDNNPFWEFGKAPFDKISSFGLPLLWNFNWTTFQPEDYDICASHKTQDECLTNTTWCGWCMISDKCMPGDKTGPFADLKCEDGWKIPEKPQPWARDVVIPTTVFCTLFCLVIYSLHFMGKKKDYLL